MRTLMTTMTAFLPTDMNHTNLAKNLRLKGERRPQKA